MTQIFNRMRIIAQTKDIFGLDLILSFFYLDLLKYEGAAKDVFNIAMDLQIILSTVFKEEPTDL